MDMMDFLNKPCRFKLKNGREVFGIIWRTGNNGNSEYFFSTLAEYNKYKKALSQMDQETCGRILEKFKKINIKDILSAEDMPGTIAI